MTKRKRQFLWLRTISIALALVGVFGLLGAFQITKLGSSIFSFFELVMRNFAWAGPFLALVLSFFLWPTPGSVRASSGKKSSSGSKTGFAKKRAGSSKSQRYTEIVEKKITIPGGKLVTLKGFEKYFSSPDWPELKGESSVQESMSELGRDFPSYFGEGQKPIPKLSPKLTALHGMKDYFSTVDLEVIEESQDAGIPMQIHDEESLGARETASAQYAAEYLPNIDLSEKQLASECLILNDIARPDLVAASNLSIKDLSVMDLGAKGFDIKGLGAEDIGVAGQVAKLVQKIQNVNPNPNTRKWQLPGPELMEPFSPVMRDSVLDNSPHQLEGLLQDFGIKAKVIRVHRGPVITRYELAPAPGVKVSRIVNLADDIALSLAARDVRIEAPIPGKSAIGIEVPNKEPQVVGFREVLETEFFQENSSHLKIALGKDIGGQPVVGDLGKMPHLLVAGATGAGKSVCISAIINSILYNSTPAQVKFLLIDPKVVELSLYNGIPHLVAPVVTDPKRAAAALKWLVKEMEARYELFAQTGVRDIERYNRLQEGGQDTPALPLIVVIIDELADLMLVAGEVEETICRLAQMARAAGIHLVLATQRPSVDVITGLIKANIPSRIAFAVSSQIDSRTILDSAGAEKLLGRGDMLFSPQGLNKPLRVQGCLVKDEEVQRIIKYWRDQGKPEYLAVESTFNESVARAGDTGEDDLFGEAGRLIIGTGMASVSFLQRRLKVGYARAARLMDMLEEQGVVGGYEGSKPRQVLISIEEFEERFG